MHAHTELVEPKERFALEDWITWTSGQLCNGWLIGQLRGLGAPPNIAHTASEHSTQLALVVAAGMGVAIIPRLGREPVPEGVRPVAIRPRLSRQVYALWRARAARRPAITAVVAALATVHKRLCPARWAGTVVTHQPQ